MAGKKLVPKIQLYVKLSAIIFLTLFAIVQYFLILRHKSPNVSDSYFYKHIFYQIQGDTYQEAYLKNLKAIDFGKTDAITFNIFQNPQVYQKTLSFFSKRILYPYLAYWTNLVVKNEFLAFIFPVFISYLGIIWLTFYFCLKRFNYFFASLATAFLIAFYPFLDWSTYFLTDVIGTFLWMLSLFFAYQYFKFKRKAHLIFLGATVIISLLNREQTVLILPLFLLLYLMCIFYRFPKTAKNRIFKILATVSILILPYSILSFILPGPSVWESLEYMRNNFGLNSYNYTTQDNIIYLIRALPVNHAALIIDIGRHHWWFALTGLAVLTQVQVLFFSKKREFLDLLLLSSGLASYSMIIWPFLSYRFIFPVIISIIYFATKLFFDFAKITEPHENS